MNQITVYQTDANGAFLHPVVATELAMSPGTYNVPFGAKLNPPPEAPEGHVAVAVGDDWAVLEDHRKDTLYLVDSGEPYAFKTTLAVGGAAVRYTGLGAIPAWLTDQAPAPQEPIPQTEEPAPENDPAQDAE